MKNGLTISSAIFLFVAALALAGCKSDGDPGPQGDTGTTGSKGATGSTGETGDDGKDFPDYGKVVIYLDGTRPDEQPFKDTLNFKFCPTRVSEYSYAAPFDLADNYDVYFYIQRFTSLNFDEGSNYVEVNFEPVLKTVSDTTKNFLINIWSTVLINSDGKAFTLSGEFHDAPDFIGEPSVTDASVTAFSYTPATGRYKWKFSFTVPAENNSTASALSVSGYVDATVFQSLIPAEPGRVGPRNYFPGHQ